MNNFLIVLFIISLIYLAKIELVKNYFSLLAIQGLLLFGMALVELHEIDPLGFSFILVETLVFKALFVPWFLYRITKNRLSKYIAKPIKGYFSVFFAMLIIIGSFTTGHLIHDQFLEVKYFTAAISSILVGLFVAINNRDLTTHLVSYLVIENGIFLLSIALGAEMPMFVNTAILLDIFSSVLIMGIFFNKMKDYFQNADVDQLSNLKD